MSIDQQPPPHSGEPSNLGWPLVVMFAVAVAAVTTVAVTGGDLAAFQAALSVALGALGALAGVGAWINSTRAARQTNGALDARMRAAFLDALSAAQTPAGGVASPAAPGGASDQGGTP